MTRFGANYSAALLAIGFSLLTRVVVAAPPLDAGALPPGYITVETERCAFVVRPENEGLVDDLGRVCGGPLVEIFEQLGVPLPAGGKVRIEIRIVESPDDIGSVSPEGAHPPGWAGAVAYPRHNLIVLPLHHKSGAPSLDLDVTLEHELSHLALRQALGGARVSRWLSEGIAVQQSEHSSIGRLWSLWLAALNDRVLPLGAIESYRSSASEAELAYAQSVDFVGYLLRQRGWHGIRQLVDTIASGEPEHVAVGQTYGRSLAWLESEWRTELSKRMDWVPILTGSTTLWLIITAILILAYFVVRRRRKLRLAEMAVEEDSVERLIGVFERRKMYEAIKKREGKKGEPPVVRIDDDLHTLH